MQFRKFYNSWLESDGLDEVVIYSWHLEINGMNKFKEKFKHLENALKIWVKQIIKHVMI